MTLTTTKITMVNGNWTRVPVVITRKGNGWVERFLEPAATVKKGEAA